MVPFCYLYTCTANELTSAYAGGVEEVPLMWKVTVVERLNEPLVPLTVTLYDPVVAPVQERVEVTDPPLVGVTFDGLRLQVKPDEGDIVAVKATAVLNPFCLHTVIME